MCVCFFYPDRTSQPLVMRGLNSQPQQMNWAAVLWFQSTTFIKTLVKAWNRGTVKGVRSRSSQTWTLLHVCVRESNQLQGLFITVSLTCNWPHGEESVIRHDYAGSAADRLTSGRRASSLFLPPGGTLSSGWSGYNCVQCVLLRVWMQWHVCESSVRRCSNLYNRI